MGQESIGLIRERNSPAFGRSNYPYSTLQAILCPSPVDWEDGIFFPK